MDEITRSTGALLLGTFTIAALHAVIPSHWLAFAVVGRAQGWSLRRALSITLLAGMGHMLMVVLLGVVVSTAGRLVLKVIPPAYEHVAMALSLIVLGGYFLLPLLRGRGGCCHEHHHDYHLPERVLGEQANVGRREVTAIGALVMGLTLSPCLDLLPMYLASASLPSRTLILISAVMLLTTLSIMLGLVALTLLGLRRLNLHWLEENESLAVGSVLIALGVLMFFV